MAVVVVLIAVIAFTVQQQPPPAIAEFAPQAAQELSKFGAGVGVGGVGGFQPRVLGDEDEKKSLQDRDGERERRNRALGAEDQTRIVPRTKRCVVWPTGEQTQTEDPQSPPCVAHWEGDNGGATYQGVTRDTIRITNTKGTDVQEAWQQRMVDALVTYFNRRFQFYGRKLEVVNHRPPGVKNPAGEAALAQAVYEEDKSFAALPDWGYSVFYRELAQRGIIGVVNPQGNSWMGENGRYGLKALHPYIWQYEMSGNKFMANVGEFVCKRLAGKRARHAGKALRDKRRVFGLFLFQKPGTDISTKPLKAELGRCNQRLKVEFNLDTWPAWESMAAKFKNEGVTTLIMPGTGWWVQQYLTNFLTEQDYYPELLSGQDEGPGINDIAANGVHRDHKLMLTHQPMYLRDSRQPTFIAMREVNPAWEGSGQWGAIYSYRPLLLIASGIQMAGPNLNPRTFAAGLHRTVFPNPPDPRMEGKVGFIDGDHTMMNDVAQGYWDRHTPFAWPESGSICYLQRGARYSLGNWGKAGGEFYGQPKGRCFNGRQV